jgi:hypothetical protein
MRDSILSYHYSDRLKALLLIADNLLGAYEASGEGRDIIYALFDSIEGEINLSRAVSKSKEKEWEDIRHLIHQSMKEFNVGSMAKSREWMGRAISKVTTIAERAMQKLDLDYD